MMPGFRFRLNPNDSGSSTQGILGSGGLSLIVIVALIVIAIVLIVLTIREYNLQKKKKK
jgi:hypothetical protein